MSGKIVLSGGPINKIELGHLNVSKVFFGDTLMYQKGQSPVPVRKIRIVGDATYSTTQATDGGTSITVRPRANKIFSALPAISGLETIPPITEVSQTYQGSIQGRKCQCTKTCHRFTVPKADYEAATQIVVMVSTEPAPNTHTCTVSIDTSNLVSEQDWPNGDYPLPEGVYPIVALSLSNTDTHIVPYSLNKQYTKNGTYKTTYTGSSDTITDSLAGIPLSEATRVSFDIDHTSLSPDIYIPPMPDATSTYNFDDYFWAYGSVATPIKYDEGYDAGSMVSLSCDGANIDYTRKRDSGVFLSWKLLMKNVSSSHVYLSCHNLALICHCSVRLNHIQSPNLSFYVDHGYKDYMDGLLGLAISPKILTADDGYYLPANYRDLFSSQDITRIVREQSIPAMFSPVYGFYFRPAGYANTNPVLELSAISAPENLAGRTFSTSMVGLKDDWGCGFDGDPRDPATTAASFVYGYNGLSYSYIAYTDSCSGSTEKCTSTISLVFGGSSSGAVTVATYKDVTLGDPELAIPNPPITITFNEGEVLDRRWLMTFLLQFEEVTQ